jgi:predicted CoA-binding protein
MKKKTLVIGASPKPNRYSHMAVDRLKASGHEVIALGSRAIEAGAWNIIEGRPEISDLDTVTLYLNPKRQEQYYDYVTELNPKRVIFNPGTENAEFVEMLNQAGIESEIACTLVLLSTEQY